MFGINDSNQNTSTPPVDGPPDNATPALPPSPFMDSPAGTPITPVPANPSSAPFLPTEPLTPAPEPHSSPSGPVANEDALINLKGQALTSLTPLVGHLDQTPEEKFKTTMMLIQASDNSSLVKQAYEAANQIPDEKIRAQALLDVVNEINYFTQKDADKPKI